MGKTRKYEGQAIVTSTNVREEATVIPFTLTATSQGDDKWRLAVDRQGSIVTYGPGRFPQQGWESYVLTHIEDCFHPRVMETISFKGRWVQ